jgi:hypothetical protein
MVLLVRCVLLCDRHTLYDNDITIGVMSCGVNDFQIGRILSRIGTLSRRGVVPSVRRTVAANVLSRTIIQLWLRCSRTYCTRIVYDVYYCVGVERYRLRRVGFGYDINNWTRHTTKTDRNLSLFTLLRARSVFFIFRIISYLRYALCTMPMRVTTTINRFGAYSIHFTGVGMIYCYCI